MVRYLAWAIGLAGLAWLVPTLIIDLNTPFPEGNSERLLRTAFGSATPASVGLEVAAAFSLLLIVALAPSPAAVRLARIGRCHLAGFRPGRLVAAAG